MALRPLPDTEFLRQLLRYEPETGKLYWRPRTPEQFPNDPIPKAERCARWNTRYAGKEAMTAKMATGYKHGSIFDVHYRTHRIIWKMVTGEEPEQIDHLNGDRCDNRLCNLRPCTNLANSRNQRRSSRNKTGVTGVTWRESMKRWGAHITVNGRSVSLGWFKTFDEAVLARKAGERSAGFHPNHGRASILK